MKLQLLGVLLFISAITAVNGQSTIAPFSKSGFYLTMAYQSIEAVNKELKIVKASTITEKDAYEGTLLMTKAGLVKNPAEKIKYFKSGRAELEIRIKKNITDIELRFLRLMIQENAPPVVNYKGDLKEDKEFIERSFKTLSPEMQKYILDYSKRSKILNLKDF
jgi:hypothetical protein